MYLENCIIRNIDDKIFKYLNQDIRGMSEHFMSDNTNVSVNLVRRKSNFIK